MYKIETDNGTYITVILCRLNILINTKHFSIVLANTKHCEMKAAIVTMATEEIICRKPV